MRIKIPPLSISPLVIIVILSVLVQFTRTYDCVPKFPLIDQWQGADIGSSIPLPDGRVVWTFGDTMYGDKRYVQVWPRMVHNTIGISTCENGVWNITYYIQKDTNGSVVPFFGLPLPQDPQTWSWPLDGVYYNEALWVALLITAWDGSINDFKPIGASLAKVTNLDENPLEWNITYYPLVDNGVGAYPSASTFIDGDYLYIYTLNETNRVMILPRIPLSKLDDPKNNIQYLAQDGTWKQGFVPSDAKVVLEEGVSEMSVRYHPEFKKWVLIQVSSVFFGDEVWLRFAPDMSGPWSNYSVIYKFPEMQKNYSDYNPNYFCYAVKEHPEFEAEPQQLLFTYVCNSYNIQDAEQDYNIYFPIAVSIPNILPAPVETSYQALLTNLLNMLDQLMSLFNSYYNLYKK